MTARPVQRVGTVRRKAYRRQLTNVIAAIIVLQDNIPNDPQSSSVRLVIIVLMEAQANARVCQALIRTSTDNGSAKDVQLVSIVMLLS